MRSSSRYVAAAALLVSILASVTVVGSPARAQADADAEARELADRYAPIVMLRTQADDCAPDGEPFAPMSVDRILDNPQIALRQLGNGDPTVRRGPTAADLAELGGGFYLDLPGDALDPGCLYEEDHDRFSAGQPAVVYAHIVLEDGHPDVLVLQYWLYWYYNDWNNKHESDWEFVQLLFPASSVAEALTTEPTRVGYAQHEGGEWAGWHDEKLQREDTHPVVHSSQRSHASYFSPAVYMGRGASEGFGCDNTESPSTRVAPDVVVLPNGPIPAGDPLAWIAFEGRWGERHGGPNNGPTGPNTKPQWTAPLTWQDGLRDASVVVPGGDSSAAEVVDAFCAVVAWGSVQYVQFVASPVRVLLALGAFAAFVAFLVRRTSWGAVSATPLRRRRRAGQIWRLAGAECRRRPGVFAAVGVIAVPVAVLAAVLGILVAHAPLLGRLIEVADEDAASTRIVASSVIGGALIALPFVAVSALVAAVVDDRGQRLSLRPARVVVRDRAGPLLTAFALAVVAIVLVSVTVVGVPVAAWLFVRWQFMVQATVLEGRSARAALTRSGELTTGRWWHTAVVTGVTVVVANGVGIIVGLLVLVLFTGLPLWALSAIVVLCNILALPFGAIVMTYLYGDAVAEAGRSADHEATAEPVPV